MPHSEREHHALRDVGRKQNSVFFSFLRPRGRDWNGGNDPTKARSYATMRIGSQYTVALRAIATRDANDPAAIRA